ncbi:putative zinc finger (C-x8-C-x5-C-x3-H)-2 [Cryptosporidium felis]|nr:putative zinc finger (C-x8-C-x5-C-x3-H)-2 [Cryptosporidium felis]
MAPKNQSKQEKGQLRALEKQKQKIIEDKTFGLKNKNKSKSVQKYIKSVTSQINNSKGSQANQELKAAQAKEEKKKQAQQQALLAALFKGTENIKKVSVDDTRKADPSTIKAEQKIDLYIDQRDQKQGSGSKKTPIAQEPTTFSTDIICKHFLTAVEKKQYGWFWVCPEGGDNCKYRHCLPKGYVIKEQESENEGNSDVEEETLEEKIERQRLELPGPGTPVTFETFIEWKKKKEKEEEEKAKIEAAKQGKQMSGRDLFVYDPSLFVDDEDAAGGDTYAFDEDAFLSDDDIQELNNYNESLNFEKIESNNEPSDSPQGEDKISDIKINHCIFQNEIDLPE